MRNDPSSASFDAADGVTAGVGGGMGMLGAWVKMPCGAMLSLCEMSAREIDSGPLKMLSRRMP